MQTVYNSGIRIFGFLMWLASFVNPKAKLWIDGRKNVFQTLKSQNRNGESWFWVHASSLGEFEQGRPLIEALKQRWPQHRILLTFFSPSGYQVRKNYEYADCVVYLPADTPKNAHHLIGLFPLKAVFFIKYDFWFNYMIAIAQKQIPMYFVSAKFRASQHFFKWYGSWFRKKLKTASHFFVQDDYSVQLLNSIGISAVSRTGDTRFDRVFRLSQQATTLPVIEQFKGNCKIIVAGSTWPDDEKLLLPLLKNLPKNYKIIIAPHDISEKHIENIEKQWNQPTVRYSDYIQNENCNLLIINNIGILSTIYQYAEFAYIGGGFGASIHNIQEAVTYGCPVIFGPKHKKFKEAVDLAQLGGAFVVNDTHSLNQAIQNLVSNDAVRNKASVDCRSYVLSQIGATGRIMNHLEKSFSGNKKV